MRSHPPLSLAQNEEAFIQDGASPSITHISPHRLASLTAWTQQLVVLDDMTLSEAVREFNRYNRVQLRLTDTDLGHLRLGGTFNFKRPTALAASLQKLRCQVRPEYDNAILISKCEPPVDAPQEWRTRG